MRYYTRSGRALEDLGADLDYALGLPPGARANDLSAGSDFDRRPGQDHLGGDDLSGAATAGSEWTSSGRRTGRSPRQPLTRKLAIKTAIARGAPSPSQQWSGVQRSSQLGHRGGAPAL